MKIQTFSHDVVKELHDGDPAVRVIVEQLGIHSSCEEFSDGKKATVYDNLMPCEYNVNVRFAWCKQNMHAPLTYTVLLPLNKYFQQLTCTLAQPSPPPASMPHSWSWPLLHSLEAPGAYQAGTTDSRQTKNVILITNIQCCYSCSSYTVSD